jgi:hypothetical protein
MKGRTEFNQVAKKKIKKPTPTPHKTMGNLQL